MLSRFLLASPPRSPLKRRARHQHGPSQFRFIPLLSSLDNLILGSSKRYGVSEEIYRSGSSWTRTKRRRHGNSKSSSKNMEARAKDDLPHRALFIPSTPVLHGETSLSKISSSTEDTGLGVQVIHSTPYPTSLSPFVDPSGQGQPLLPIADNGKYHQPLAPNPHPLTSLFSRDRS